MKVKQRHERVFLVAGIRNVDAFDGARVGEELHYRGVVEWGFRAPEVLALLRKARTSARTSPFADLKTMRGVAGAAVEAAVEAEVSYAEVVEVRLRAPV